MNILFVSNKSGCCGSVALGGRRLTGVVVALLGLFPAAMLGTGYWLGSGNALPPDAMAAALQGELQQQREELAQARQSAESNLDALTLRLGQMQAHVVRIDALGERLTHMAKLDDGEFNFTQPPAQGGPEESSVMSTIAVPDFVAQLETLAQQMRDRESQLSVLQEFIMSKNLQEEVMPAGRPANTGWISSSFGMRTDPFTGKLAFHRGVDIAAKEGGEVVSVAAGVVTFADKKYGYGNMVEVTHGNGYVTRYGHNDTMAVEVGDTVKKGQVIAAIGNTGRSTGPHVHFEVWRDGKAVDPMKYIQAAAH